MRREYRVFNREHKEGPLYGSVERKAGIGIPVAGMKALAKFDTMNHAQPRKAVQENSGIDENAWSAWLEKGRKHDRVRRHRLRATVYVFIILVACVVIWIYLPFSQKNR